MFCALTCVHSTILRPGFVLFRAIFFFSFLQTIFEQDWGTEKLCAELIQYVTVSLLRFRLSFASAAP